ncbi:uncharacterized protein LOC144923618 [Branchiostoma floridae x Branchiostoma belcheri]
MGYVMNENTCQDIDECQTTEGSVCHHYCINLVGNFTCGCEEGYHLSDDGHSCKDIDECSVLNNCSQRCDNSPGTYVCGCWEGFTLQSDGLLCEPEKPCGLNEDPGCDPGTSDCILTVDGDPTCVCNKGYILLEDGVTCQDKNECATGENHCDQICNNTAGGYNCSCFDGFELTNNPVHPCSDIDECYEGTYNCSKGELCVNAPGSYTCVCSPGMYRQGEICSPSTTASSIATVPSDSHQTYHDNAVVIVVEMRLEELTDVKLESVKVATAASVTSWCASHMQEYEACSLERARKKRDSYAIRVYSENVRFLASFPRSLSDDVIAIAEYVTLQTSVLPADILFSAIQHGVVIIQDALGDKRIVRVVKATLFNITDEVPPTELQPAMEPAIYVVTGLAGGLVVAVVIAFLYRCKRKSKISPRSEDIALTPEDHPQVLSMKSPSSLGALTDVSI